jgi:hypothetical protein
MVNCILDQLFYVSIFKMVRILDLGGKRRRRYLDSAWKNGADPRFKREEKEIFGFSMEKQSGS